ncbi:MAG: T9SS type A sorting domain-containing protein [Ignavibacteriaceae bacterium]|nr:T9SS type A sorting domain-containing protein [Ignavibacteriaceae bacterium]
MRGSKELNALPKYFTLSQNYPNPFNPTTAISYSLPSSSNVKLIIYNTLGQSIKTLESGYKTAGNYSINFNASALPSGIYFYKLEAGQCSQIKKMMLIK